MATKTFITGEVLTAADTNAYLANAGLDYVTGTTYTTAASVTVDGCFTSGATIYVIVANWSASSDGQNIQARLRSGGVDETSANYLMGGSYQLNTGASGVINQNGATIWNLGASSQYVNHMVWTVNQPQESTRTSMTCQNFANGPGAAANYQLGGVLATGTQYNGFKISPSAGTITGKLRVYAYRQA